MRASRPGLPTSALPPTALSAAEHLRSALLSVLGRDLVAMWVDGGTTFPDRPLTTGDLDVSIVLADVTPDERDPNLWRSDPTSRPSRVIAERRAVERAHGYDIDANELVLDEMGGHDRPGAAFVSARRLNVWPIVRAHWLAGQYVHLHGLRPEDLVVAPTAEDLRRSLSREVEHLERHVHEGDAADPYEATYAVCTGCRVLYALATGSPVVSKRSAAAWGRANLPERWHAAIDAAGRAYDGAASPEDHELLRRTMPSFVEMVRGHLPLSKPRAPGQLPRWS